MDDSRSVSDGERLRDLSAETESVVDGELAAFETGGEGFAIE
jgi:hypothetical protein